MALLFVRGGVGRVETEEVGEVALDDDGVGGEAGEFVMKDMTACCTGEWEGRRISSIACCKADDRIPQQTRSDVRS
jgi:hypothetical protein